MHPDHLRSSIGSGRNRKPRKGGSGEEKISRIAINAFHVTFIFPYISTWSAEGLSAQGPRMLQIFFQIHALIFQTSKNSPPLPPSIICAPLLDEKVSPRGRDTPCRGVRQQQASQSVPGEDPDEKNQWLKLSMCAFWPN